MAVSYLEKKFLVIDDFGEFRRSVKTMVQQLGAPDVDMASSAEEALELCYRKRYDIILSDYNLGDGKDGQQLLEELIVTNRIKASAIFLMLTAENTTAMVMGALEHQPDGYVTKPFNKSTLQQRLDKLVEKKEVTKAIDTALEKKDYAKVIALCDAEIQQNSKIVMFAQRTKAETLEKIGKRAEASEIYRSACNERPVPWALLGYGRMLLERGDAMAARDHFEMIVKQLPMLLGAHDGLAAALAALGEKERAQQILVAATKMSPKAVVRQSKLGKLSVELDDFETATKAFRSAVHQGRHSVHKSSEHYLQFAHCLSQSMQSNQADNRRLFDEAQRTLHELETDYKGDSTLAMRSLLLQGEMQIKQQKAKEADALLAGAKKLLAQTQQTLTPDAALQVANQFKLLGDADSARNVLQQCLDLYGDDPRLQAKAAEIVGDVQTAVEQERAVQFNSEGIAQFQQARFDEAIMSFRRAIALSPKNISIVLNTVQVLLEVARRQNYPEELINESSECLQRVQSIPPEDKRYGRFIELQKSVAQAYANRTNPKAS